MKLEKIKYKAYHKIEKSIQDVHGIDFERGFVWLGVRDNDGKPIWIQSKFVELLRFILTDKNDKEIYDSDIVKATKDEIGGMDIEPMEVFWDEDRCGWAVNPGEHCLMLDKGYLWKNIEKVGNKFENPEWLEEMKNE